MRFGRGKLKSNINIMFLAEPRSMLFANVYKVGIRRILFFYTAHLVELSVFGLKVFFYLFASHSRLEYIRVGDDCRLISVFALTLLAFEGHSQKE